MNADQFAEYILRKLKQISADRQDVRTRHLYEQGVLIGLLSTLSERDSQNFDVIRKRLDKLADK